MREKKFADVFGEQYDPDLLKEPYRPIHVMVEDTVERGQMKAVFHGIHRVLQLAHADSGRIPVKNFGHWRLPGEVVSRQRAHRLQFD